MGTSWLLCVILLLWSVHADYTAAVVEHVPIVSFALNLTRSAAVSVMQTNLDVYEEQIRAARQQGAEIIVFPEDGLYGSGFESPQQAMPYMEPIPEVCRGCALADSVVNPCLDPTQFNTTQLTITYQLSCLARQHQMVLVANMGDVQPCQHKSVCQFNTLVAFGADGQLLGKYHKENLYQHGVWDRPTGQLPQFFSVDFASGERVSFGMFICFDILFESPGLDLVRDFGIRHFVFPTWWVNPASIPFMPSTEVQQAWSRQTDSNLLAADIGVGFYNTGSGLFSRGDILDVWFDAVPLARRERLLVAKMPTFGDDGFIASTASVGRPSTKRGHVSGRSVGSSVYPGSDICEFVPWTPVPGKTVTVKASRNTTTCSLSATVVANPQDTEFALMACQGLAFQHAHEANICAIAPCRDGQCAVLNIDTHQTTFSHILLRAEFGEDLPILPMIGGDNVTLLAKEATEFSQLSPRSWSWELLHNSGGLNVMNAVLCAQLR